MGDRSEDYEFENRALLELALTHASTGRSENNERLEFLGDTVLDLIVAEELYGLDSALSEGEMTEFKAWVVSREVLAGAARELGLGERAYLGHGMRARKLPRSVFANLYEAYLGAIYLDGGIEAARAFTLRSLADPLARVSEPQETHNPKQELQQRSQQTTGEPPNYQLIDERGLAHSKAFLVAAEIEDRRFPSAWGRTVKEAERWAAFEALQVLDAESEG